GVACSLRLHLRSAAGQQLGEDCLRYLNSPASNRFQNSSGVYFSRFSTLTMIVLRLVIRRSTLIPSVIPLGTTLTSIKAMPCNGKRSRTGQPLMASEVSGIPLSGIKLCTPLQELRFSVVSFMPCSGVKSLIPLHLSKSKEMSG